MLERIQLPRFINCNINNHCYIRIDEDIESCYIHIWYYLEWTNLMLLYRQLVKTFKVNKPYGLSVSTVTLYYKLKRFLPEKLT